ncbi:hypothetical protein HRF87_27180 [Bacillus sp. CRN 9]|nr:hypothetical protein [Bacillus sp. CRN 9]
MQIVCKYCGSENGFYTEERVTGRATIYYKGNGYMRADQGSMYDSLTHSGGKKAYCRDCFKYIGKSEKLISGNREIDESY